MTEPATVRGAVAKRDDKPATITPATHVREVIQRQADRLAAVSPRGFDSERFAHLVITAVKATPALMDCFATPQGELSVLLAAMQAAEVGLEPNTPTQQCWLLPRRNGQRVECQLSIGYRGYIALATRSDRVKTLFAEVVREGDDFDYHRGLEADVLHWKPGDTRGDLTHAFAVVRFTNGGYNFIVLDRKQVEARRAQSDSYRNERARPYSPWTTATESMWRKSAVRALVPYLPLAADAARFVGADESSLTVDDGEIIPAGYTHDDPDALEAAGTETAE